MSSNLARDPELVELVALFVRELPRRLTDLRHAFHGRDCEEVRRLAHQLAGTGGSYGFPSITSAARELETAARDVLPRADIRTALDHLAEVCSHVCAAERL